MSFKTRLSRHIYFQPSRDRALDREVVLGVVAIGSGVMAGLLLVSGVFNWPLLGFCSLFVACLLLSRNRPAVMAAPLIVSGIRLLLGWFIYRRSPLLLASIGCWAVGLLFVRIARR